MLITARDFCEIAKKVAEGKYNYAAVDFETTGLKARSGDTAFIMGFCLGNGERIVGSVRLDDPNIKFPLELFFSSKTTKYLAHNAKFEMSFLKRQFGIEIKGDIWDTEVFARIENNSHMSYSLQSCAERIGKSKHKPVLECIKKLKHDYTKLSDELLIPYVEQDAVLSADLYVHQRQTLLTWQQSDVPISRIVRLEMETTRNLFQMEESGLLLDVNYCRDALDYEKAKAHKAASEFEKLTGTPFVDSRKCLEPIFQKHGIPYKRTEKGNASFNAETLKLSVGNPITDAILSHRDALKRSSTYWENFLQLHVGGVIYPNIRQSGTASGRFSANDPNVQNWPDDSSDVSCAYPVRRAFIARPGSKIVSIDYAQMEARLAADEARSLKMIELIKTGADIHQLTADDARCERGKAKNVRFARQYGAGIPKLSKMLELPEVEVRRIIDAMDRMAPEIKEYSYALSNQVKTRGYTYNAYGRRYFFDQGFEYKAFNYRIQGGCSDIMRIALCNIAAILREYPEIKMLIVVHDELVFDIPSASLGVIPRLREAMISAHETMKLLPMDVSVSIGDNYHDLKEVV